MKTVNTLISAYNSRKALAALIFAFITHNIEEAYFICRYPVQSPVSFIQLPTCRQFLWAVSIVTFIGIIVSVRALTTKKPSVYLFLSTALAVILLFNVFLPHVIVAVYSFQYTPGLVSALGLNLPLSLMVLLKNRKQNTKTLFLKQISIGFLIGYVLFVLIMRMVIIFIK